MSILTPFQPTVDQQAVNAAALAALAHLPEQAAVLPLAGVQDLTLSDFPGNPATIFFFRGCNMACGYCHNEAIRSAGPRLPLRPALQRVIERRNRVPGVVLSGGEPTIHAGLGVLASFLRSNGLRVKLDTNGSRPQVMQQAIQDGWADYIALDVKASVHNTELHDQVCARSGYAPRVRAALHILRHRLAPERWEVRTTVCGQQHRLEDLLEIVDELRPGERWFLQAVRPPAGGSEHCDAPAATLLAEAAAMASLKGVVVGVR